ncbi:hypothetical protein H1R20_g1493, partial [Candolleomyces eurysporus]
MVDSLPLELLERVFRLAHPEVNVFHKPEYEGGSSTWTLSAVSRSWRAAAIGAKSLWTKLLIEDPQKDASIPPAISRLCLALSRSAPLPFWVCIQHICLTSFEWGRDFDDGEGSQIDMIILSPILANAHRLEGFTAKLPTLLFQRFAMQQIPFPRLQALTLDSGGLETSGLSGDETCVVDAPLLRNLELSALSRDRWTSTFLDNRRRSPRIKISWSQLTYFSFKYNVLDCEGFQGFYLFLSQMANLETFILQDDAVYHTRWPVQQGKPRYLFERLKTLRVFAAHSAMFSLLGTMRTPHLDHLNLELKNGSPFDGVLHREEYRGKGDMKGAWERAFVNGITGLLDTLESRSSVTSLGLWGFQTLPVVKIVKQLPSLRKLATKDLEEGLIDFLFSGWEQDLGTASASRSFPDLQSLTFEINIQAIENTHGTNERILQMIESRLQNRQEIKLEHVRIMYRGSGHSILKNAFLDPLAKWTDTSSPHRIGLDPVKIDGIHGELLFID